MFQQLYIYQDSNHLTDKVFLTADVSLVSYRANSMNRDLSSDPGETENITASGSRHPGTRRRHRDYLEGSEQTGNLVGIVSHTDKEQLVPSRKQTSLRKYSFPGRMFQRVHSRFPL